MSLITLQSRLASYMEGVVNKGAGEVQRRETQLAFMAGAVATLQVLDSISSLEDDDPAAAKAMGELQDYLASKSSELISDAFKAAGRTRESGLNSGDLAAAMMRDGAGS